MSPVVALSASACRGRLLAAKLSGGAQAWLVVHYNTSEYFHTERTDMPIISTQSTDSAAAYFTSSRRCSDNSEISALVVSTMKTPSRTALKGVIEPLARFYFKYLFQLASASKEKTD